MFLRTANPSIKYASQAESTMIASSTFWKGGRCSPAALLSCHQRHAPLPLGHSRHCCISAAPWQQQGQQQRQWQQQRAPSRCLRGLRVTRPCRAVSAQQPSPPDPDMLEHVWGLGKD